MHHSDLSSIISEFEIDPLRYGFKEIGQGYINKTFCVTHPSEPSYILQRINKEVFPEIPAIMENIESALEYLRGEDYESIRLIKTKKNKTLLITEKGEYWRLMTAIENSIAFTNTKKGIVAFEAAKILAKFHALLQNAPPEKFKVVLPNFLDLEYRSSQFYQALEGAEKETLSKAKNAIHKAKKTLQFLQEKDPGDLPIRVCHNDTKLSNILFDKDSQKALCLIDLDTIMPGRFYYDFGDAIRTLVNSSPEDERDLRKIHFDKKQFARCLDGMKELRSILQEEEINSLAYGVVYMPFLHGLRALTDYLMKNKYYKVSYPQQNLDRSNSLFEFAMLAESNYTYMQEAIGKYFH